MSNAANEWGHADGAERDSAHIEVSSTLGRVAEWQNESDSDELMDRLTR